MYYVWGIKEQRHAMNAPKNITTSKGIKLNLVEQFSGISEIGCTMQAGYVGGRGVEYFVQFFANGITRIINTRSAKTEIVII